MATQISATNVLDLEEHGERLLQLLTEPLLAHDSQSAAGRRAQEAIRSGLFEHLWQTLETWQRQSREVA